MRRCAALVILLVLLSGAACGPSPADLPVAHEGLIAYGQTVQEALAGSGMAHHWRFIGSTGDRIDIDLAAQANQPTVALLGPDGALIAGSNAGLALSNVALPTDGIFTIVISAPAGEAERNSYTLTLHQNASALVNTPAEIPAAPTAPAAPVLAATQPNPSSLPGTAVVTGVPALVESGMRLQPRQMVQGQLQAGGEPDRFTIVGQAGETITVGMLVVAGSSVDPRLTIYGPAGDLVADVDNSFGTQSAIIVGLTLPVTGAYVAFAQDSGGQGAGLYQLAYGPGMTLIDRAQPLTLPDMLYPGQLDQPAARDIWPLDLNAGDVISAAAVVDGNSPLDPVLSLVAPDGTVLGVNDNGGSDRNAVLRLVTAPERGRYTLIVQAAANGWPGPYTLFWQIVPPAAPTALPVPATETK